MKNRNLDNHDNWATPKSFYKKLNELFHFDFDPCPLNNDITKFDGLACEWGDRTFINPPYSQKLKESFVLKALQESRKAGKQESRKVCVLLLPVSTSTKLFHEVIMKNASEILFVKGRVKFEGFNTKGELVSNKVGMHDSMIVVFDGTVGKTKIGTIEQ